MSHDMMVANLLKVVAVVAVIIARLVAIIPVVHATSSIVSLSSLSSVSQIKSSIAIVQRRKRFLQSTLLLNMCTTAYNLDSKIHFKSKGIFSIKRGGCDIENDINETITRESVSSPKLFDDSSKEDKYESTVSTATENVPARSTASTTDETTTIKITKPRQNNIKSVFQNVIKSKKFASLQQRTVVAIGLLSVLTIIIRTFHEIGIGVLLTFLSIGFYEEISTVLSPSTITTTIPASSLYKSFKKYIWFVSASIGTTIPQLLSLILQKQNTENQQILAQSSIPVLQVTSYFLVSLLIVQFIVQTNSRIQQRITATSSSLSPDSYIVQTNTSSSIDKELPYYESLQNDLVKDVVYPLLSTTISVLPVHYYLLLLQLTNGILWVIYTGILIIINDTSAYFCGIIFGRQSLVQYISPNKTIEGFVGAALITILSSIPIFQLLSQQLSVNLVHCIVLAMYISIVGPAGGLLASIIKRIYHVKDFSTILGKGGHGGLLDRFDCHLFVLPFVYNYINCINNQQQRLKLK